MTDRITAQRFHASAGVDDWRVLLASVQALYRTDCLADGIAFVTAVGELAGAVGHDPDIDLRPRSVTIRLASSDVGGISERDLHLARAISWAANGFGLVADPAGLQALEVAVDVVAGPAVHPFWRAVLGYDAGPSGRPVEELHDPLRGAPSFWFQSMDAPRTGRNRIHVDVTVPHDVAEARVAAALAAGGRLISDRRAPAFWVLGDAEGNEACVCTWQARD